MTRTPNWNLHKARGATRSMTVVVGLTRVKSRTTGDVNSKLFARTRDRSFPRSVDYQERCSRRFSGLTVARQSKRRESSTTTALIARCHRRKPSYAHERLVVREHKLPAVLRNRGVRGCVPHAVRRRVAVPKWLPNKRHHASAQRHQQDRGERDQQSDSRDADCQTSIPRPCNASTRDCRDEREVAGECDSP